MQSESSSSLRLMLAQPSQRLGVCPPMVNTTVTDTQNLGTHSFDPRATSNAADAPRLVSRPSHDGSRNHARSRAPSQRIAAGGRQVGVLVDLSCEAWPECRGWAHPILSANFGGSHPTNLA
eukprot:969339-Rhodomonas_salina.2